MPLLNFFQLKATESKQVSIGNIVRIMTDPSTKLYFLFLQWILPKFVGLNRLFQGDDALTPTVYDAMSDSYKDVLSSHMDKKYISETKLNKFDPANAEKFLPVSQTYLGVALMNLESKPEIKGHKDEKEIITYFQKDADSFL